MIIATGKFLFVAFHLDFFMQNLIKALHIIEKIQNIQMLLDSK